MEIIRVVYEHKVPSLQLNFTKLFNSIPVGYLESQRERERDEGGRKRPEEP